VRLEAVDVERAGDDRVRLVARVRVDRPRPSIETIWIEVPRALEDGLDRSGNPWLALLLPLATAYGEPLEVPLPVDRPLLHGAREVLRVWRTWYRTAVVELTAPERPRPSAPPPRRAMAFFSGGVDSFFTAVGRTAGDGVAERGRPDDLVFVEGLDVRLESADALARLRVTIPEAAGAMGFPLVRVATNLRATRWDEVDWPLLGNGCVLAAIALALGRYDLALLPGSIYYKDMAPWGSHPYTDLRLSSWDLLIRQDGCDWDRSEKIRTIAAFAAARRHLRVCFRSPQGGNCGRCKKCLLTMAALDVVAGLRACPAFPQPEGYLERLREVEVSFPSDRRHMRFALALAREAGRDDVATVLREVLDRVVEQPWDHRVRLPRGGAPRGLRALLARRRELPRELPGPPDPDVVS
jgi:hypothetical protein